MFGDSVEELQNIFAITPNDEHTLHSFRHSLNININPTILYTVLRNQTNSIKSKKNKQTQHAFQNRSRKRTQITEKSLV